MVLQGDDDGHEGRDGRRRGLPSEASGGRYATHCWALTRPLGRLGRHRLVSGGAIAQQWRVDRELREHLLGLACDLLLRRALLPRPLPLLLLLLRPSLLLLLLPRGPEATGTKGRRRRALRRRRATATRTGGASARRRSSVGRRFWAVRRVHRTNYEDAGGRVYGDDGFDALPRCGANRNEGGTGPRGPRLRTKTVGSDLAQTWLAGLRRSDAASKCQNCPPIIFRTCDYADFH